MAAIGQRIKQRRIELGMTQEELAHKMGYALYLPYIKDFRYGLLLVCYY